MEEKKLIKETHSGYIESAITPDDYIAGAERSIANKLGGIDPIIQPDGDWSSYLPEAEIQVKNFDTYGCVAFNSLNQIEILERKVFGDNPNHSDRFLYISANISPPGADPQTVYESIRNKGTVNEEELPWDNSIKTLAEFQHPNPLPQDLINKGKEWLLKYNFRHEYLPRQLSGLVSNETIKKALAYSPLGVAVQAWSFDPDKQVYVRDGEDTHWTCLVNFKENEYWGVYDSYPPFYKKLDWNYNFRIAKRVWLSENLTPQQISIFQKILDNLYKILTLQWLFLAEKKKEDTENEPKTEPKPEPKVSKLIPFAKAIEAYENAAKWRNNPGAIRDKNGKFLEFKNYQEGFSYLCDYIKRVSEGKHDAYPCGGETSMIQFFQIYAPVEDGNDPIRYCSWVCNRIETNPENKISDVV